MNATPSTEATSAPVSTPTTQRLPDALLVPLGLLQPSPTNPRKSFPQPAIEELASTIQPHGVMQPLLVRPLPGKREGDGRPAYEIVAGERRWRACGWLVAQGLQYPHHGQAPVLVRELSDGEVLALQLVENIQREDLHPLEEAEHYHLMTTHPTEAITVEALAGKIGRSPAYVYGRMSLRKLGQSAHAALLGGKLDVSVALRLAAMALPAEEEAAKVQHLTEWGGEPMGVRAATRFLLDTCSLQIKGAPFDVFSDALLPAAGACTNCPKRSSQQPQLFDGLADGDRCLDAACFAAKRQAVRDAALAEAAAAGYQVVHGPEAGALLIGGKGAMLAPGWHDLQASVPATLGDATQTVAQVMTAAKVDHAAIRVIDHPKRAELLYAVPTPVLQAALRTVQAQRSGEKAAASPAAECCAEPTRPSAAASTSPAQAAEALPAAPKRKVAAPKPPETSVLEELLDFPVVPSDVRSLNGQAMELFSALARRKVETAVTVHRCAAELRHRGHSLGLMLPPDAAQLMLLSLLPGEYGPWTLHDAARLAAISTEGMDDPEHDVLRGHRHWAQALPGTDATVMVYALLALQPPTLLAGVEIEWARRIASLLGVAWPPVQAQAEQYVADRLPAEMLARAPKAGGRGAGKKAGKAKAEPAAEGGDKAPAAGAAAEDALPGAEQTDKPAAPAPRRLGGKVAARYRNPTTGQTWTAGGLQPAWLKACLAAGAELSDYLVPGAAA